MTRFRELSRRSRFLRMRALAHRALGEYDLCGARITFMHYCENFIYRVDRPGSSASREDGSPYLPNRYVLRIHSMDDTSAIESELTWLQALSVGTDIPVPAPVLTSDGRLLAKITTPALPEGRNVSLMRWIDGRQVFNGLRPKHLAALGQVVGRLHNFSADWTPPNGFYRMHWDWDSLLGGSMLDNSIDELISSIPERYRSCFIDISEQGKRVMQTLGRGKEVYGLIHADLDMENILWNAGKAFPIDFEDCGFGYWLGDIAVALDRWAWQDDWERMRDAFREGYSQFRMLPDVQWNQLDLFIAIQFASFVLWASAFLLRDPPRVNEYEAQRDHYGDLLLRCFNR